MKDILTNLAPPILLGVGLIVPIVVKASPFELPEKVRLLASVVFTLIVWVAYFLTIGWASKWGYDNWVTVISALLATLILGIVLIAAWRQGGELQGARYFLGFAFAIFLLALSSANWVAQEDLVIIRVESNSPIDYIGVQTDPNSDDYRSVHTEDERVSRRVWIYFAPDEFAKITNIQVNHKPNSVDRLVPIYSGFPGKRYYFSGN